MKCLKKQSRTLFNMLDVITCDNCNNKNLDYYFYIGLNPIYIYYLKDCRLDEESFSFNMKLIYILKKVIEEEKLLLWFESYYEFETILDVISQIDDNIIIVIEK